MFIFTKSILYKLQNVIYIFFPKIYFLYLYFPLYLLLLALMIKTVLRSNNLTNIRFYEIKYKNRLFIFIVFFIFSMWLRFRILMLLAVAKHRNNYHRVLPSIIENHVSRPVLVISVRKKELEASVATQQHTSFHDTVKSRYISEIKDLIADCKTWLATKLYSKNDPVSFVKIVTNVFKKFYFTNICQYLIILYNVWSIFRTD